MARRSQILLQALGATLRLAVVSTLAWLAFSVNGSIVASEAKGTAPSCCSIASTCGCCCCQSAGDPSGTECAPARTGRCFCSAPIAPGERMPAAPAPVSNSQSLGLTAPFVRSLSIAEIDPPARATRPSPEIDTLHRFSGRLYQQHCALLI